MTYRIVHKTTYKYKNPVSYGTHVAYLVPRGFSTHELEITPTPATRVERTDYFGNSFTFFTIVEPHDELTIVARSKVTVAGATQWPTDSPSWDRPNRDLGAYEFVFESPRIPSNPEFRGYASPSFPPGRPITEAVLDLTKRIHDEFRFDSKATNVRTSPLEVLRSKRGVCQDFAHLEIACLRSMGVPARYVSGYIRTYPPPGRPRLVGADASHAWVRFYCSGTGWLEVDPTNNLIPSDSHVTLASGRDYGDVSPVRGVILGGRDHKLEVGVDMEPLEPAASWIG
jgi:transglutaminase-like putative cysteine protease